MPAKAPPEIVQRFFDLTNRDATLRQLSDLRPEAIIHCAAVTNVDSCEKNQSNAWKVNVEATETIAQWAAGHDAQLTFISTDSVFDGESGNYDESAATHPVNQYARTKVAAEEVVRAQIPETLIVRTNFYGQSWKERNPSLGEWMLTRLLRERGLRAFADVYFNPLLTNDLAGIIFELLARKASGVFHVAARDACSKYEYARMLASIFGLNSDCVTPISVDHSLLEARRPKNTILTVEKVTSFLGREMPSIEDGLRSFRRLFAAEHTATHVSGNSNSRTTVRAG